MGVDTRWLGTEKGRNLFGNMRNAFIVIINRDDQFR
jgi:hypothetical protein